MSGKHLCRAGKVLLSFTMACAIGISAFSYMPNSARAASIDDLKQQQAELDKRQKENQKKLDDLKNDKAKQQEYKNALDNQIATVQSQIDSYNSQILSLDNEIKNKTDEIADKQTSINDRYEKLKERLCAIYMMGEASTLELLLNSKDVMDLADKMELVKAISEHDAQLIGGLKTDMLAIAEQKKGIEDNRQQVADTKSQLDAKRGEIAALQQEAQALLDQISKNQAQTEEEKKALAEERQKADAAIDQWFKDYYAQQQQNNNNNNNNGGNNNGGNNNDGNGGSNGGGGHEGTGQFIWPTPGVTTITSGFGGRWGTTHKGIDIGAGLGHNIVAADSGTVIFTSSTCSHNYPKNGSCGCGGGYGNYMIIDHGNSYSTLYGHCTSLAVTTGQKVQKGQVIGTVGSTGHSTGYHLHFEIRVNGVAKDPMGWFN